MRRKSWSLRRRLIAWLLVPLSVLCAVMLSSAYSSAIETADKAYDRYLHSANTSRQDREYDRAERLDRIAGASYIGMEVGLVLSSYLLFFGR